MSTNAVVKVALFAGAFTALGSIGPWATILGFSTAGTEGDGIITLVLAIVAVASTLVVMSTIPTPRYGTHWVALVASALALVVAVYDVLDVSSTSGQLAGETVHASPGWGLWLTLVAAFVLTCATTLINRRVRQGAPPQN